MKRWSSAAAICAALWVLAEGHAFAQEKKEVFVDGGIADVNAAKTYIVDTSIPVAPAFSLLKAETPQSIGSGFGGDTYFHLGDSGDSFPELSAAFRPYWLVNSESLDTYRGQKTGKKYDWNDWLKHMAGRTIISAATTTVSSGETARTGAALGLSTTLFDEPDPRMDTDFSNCLQNKVLKFSDIPTLTNKDIDTIIVTLSNAGLVDTTLLAQKIREALEQNIPRNQLQVIGAVNGAYDVAQGDANDKAAAQGLIQTKTLGAMLATPIEALNEKYKDCVADAKKRYQRRADITIGAGGVWLGENDKNLDGLDFEGGSAWIGYRMPILGGNKAQKLEKRPLLGEINLYARHETRQDQKFENNVISDTETLVAFGSYSISNAEQTWRATLATSWNRRDYENRALRSNEFYRYNASIEFKAPETAIGKNTWIEIGYGALSEDVQNESDYGFVRLKFDLSNPKS